MIPSFSLQCTNAISNNSTSYFVHSDIVHNKKNSHFLNDGLTKDAFYKLFNSSKSFEEISRIHQTSRSIKNQLSAINASSSTKPKEHKLKKLELNALNYDSSVLHPTQGKWRHKLPSGLELEVISQKGIPSNSNDSQTSPSPPIVFIHGSYHAAWCWCVHWMPFFSSNGHDCYAISLLGQGESDVPDASVAGTIQSHASDLSHFISLHLSSPPILIGHSFGGLIVQAYLADMASTWQPSASHAENSSFVRLSGAILACSVPPTGNMELVKRYIKNDFISSIKITLSLAFKLFASSSSLCKESFFSKTMDEEEVKKYQFLLKSSSKIPLFDLRKLNASLPVTKPSGSVPPILVLGASDDFIVDAVGLNETAEFFLTSPMVVPDIAHDVMLDVNWKSCASMVQNWIKENIIQS